MKIISKRLPQAFNWSAEKVSKVSGLGVEWKANVCANFLHTFLTFLADNIKSDHPRKALKNLIFSGNAGSTLEYKTGPDLFAHFYPPHCV